MTLTLASSRLTPLVASWTSKSRARVVAVSAIAGPRRRPALSTTTTGNAATGVVPIVVGRRARGDAVLIKSSDGVGKRRGSVRCAAVPGPEFITPEVRRGCGWRPGDSEIRVHVGVYTLEYQLVFMLLTVQVSSYCQVLEHT